MIPVLHIEDGLVIDQNMQAYAVFVVHGPDYGFQSESEQRRQIYSVIRGCREVVGEWHLYSLALGVSPDRWKQKLPKFDDQIWQEHTEEVKTLLQNEKPFERRIYLVVPLTDVKRLELSLNNAMYFSKKAAKEMWEGMKSAVKHFVNLEQLAVGLLEKFHREKQKWKDRFGSFVNISVATLAETESWLRHGMYRGLVEPNSRLPKILPKYVSTNGSIHTTRHAGAWLQDAYIDEHPFYLEAKHPDKQISYQTFFAALRVPSEIDEEYPFGNEWIYEVENLDYPVDIALHIRVESHKEAQRKLRSKKLAAEEKWKEFEENEEEVPIELEEELQSTMELGRRLRAREPLMHIKTIIGIGAKNSEELFTRSQNISSDLSHLQLVRAPGDQQRFWQAFYPFGPSIPVSYEIPMDPGVFACGVPFATTYFGDESGFLLGETVSKRSIFIDPRLPASKLNYPPGMLIAGQPGSGKTFLLHILLVMMMSWGAKCFINDPKGHDYDDLEALHYRVRYIRFEPRGEPFNPFRLGIDGAVRDLLDLLFNNAQETMIRDYRDIIIGNALQKVMESEKQDMFVFGKALQGLYGEEKRPEVKEQINIILSLMDALYSDPFGGLLFAEDDGELPGNYDCTIVCTNHLTLPQSFKDQKQWSNRERISVALFYATAAMGLGYFTSLPSNIVKLMGLDEAWVLRLFSQGRDLINRALRLSRSLNLIPVLIMQNATDFENFGDSITSMFSWRFLLRQHKALDEVKASLRIAGLNDSEAKEWEEYFSEFSNGQGLAVDAHGRVNIIKTAVYPSYLANSFSTTPTQHNRW